jgi:hypothetical protein
MMMIIIIIIFGVYRTSDFFLFTADYMYCNELRIRN